LRVWSLELGAPLVVLCQFPYMYASFPVTSTPGMQYREQTAAGELLCGKCCSACGGWLLPGCEYVLLYAHAPYLQRTRRS
jgi:hypothetical protein